MVCIYLQKELRITNEAVSYFLLKFGKIDDGIVRQSIIDTNQEHITFLGFQVLSQNGMNDVS